ncbi:MAG TPA: hypothetical protein VMV47_16565 [Bacteroidales bacterium]|nr:hypothetical protein [Bacteroidales bacterium]
MNNLRNRIIILMAAMLLVIMKVNSQTALPEELTNNSIDEQINYLENRTRIYENYRAIREDMFQKINRNIRDTIAADKNKINELNDLTSALRATYDSLNIILETTTSNLNEMTATKNSIKVLGMEVNKVTYNTILWTIILVLVALLSAGFLVFKRNLFTTIRTGKELQELKEEFEDYRQSTRIAREKMQIDHFNEIKKLKGR